MGLDLVMTYPHTLASRIERSVSDVRQGMAVLLNVQPEEKEEKQVTQITRPSTLVICNGHKNGNQHFTLTYDSDVAAREACHLVNSGQTHGPDYHACIIWPSGASEGSISAYRVWRDSIRGSDDCHTFS